jgi:hypothetical protein
MYLSISLFLSGSALRPLKLVRHMSIEKYTRCFILSYISVCASILTSVSRVCISVRASVCIPIRASVCIPIRASVRILIRASVCIPIRASIYKPIYTSIYIPNL